MRDVAVVGFAQRQMEEFDGSPTCVELLVPLFAECYEQTGWTRRDIGFWCSGSSDYLAGRSFSFVQAVDAIGVIPPVNESHVEMDAAWALYEAWVKIQTGEVDTALVYGFGKSSAGVLRRTLALQLDPYTMTPLWPDTVSLAGLQARAGIDAGALGRARDGRGGQPLAHRRGEERVRRSARAARRSRSCSPGRCTPTRCASTTAPPSPTGPRRSCWPPTTGPARWRERPAWITSLSTYVDPISMGTRDLTRSPSTALAAAQVRPRRCRGGRAARAVQPPGADPAHRARPGRRRRDQPVGRAARGNPMFTGGLIRFGEAAKQVWSGERDQGARPRDQRTGTAAEPRVRDGRPDRMAA